MSKYNLFKTSKRARYTKILNSEYGNRLISTLEWQSIQDEMKNSKTFCVSDIMCQIGSGKICVPHSLVYAMSLICVQKRYNYNIALLLLKPYILTICSLHLCRVYLKTMRSSAIWILLRLIDKELNYYVCRWPYFFSSI